MPEPRPLAPGPRPLLAGPWPLFFLLLAGGCGYVGDPLPPLANVPGHIQDLAAVQRGARLIVHFSPPAETTEGRAITKPLRLDLRIGTHTSPFSPSVWAATAHQVAPAGVKNGIAEYEVPSTPWTGQDVTMAAQAIGANGKSSGWSNFVNLTVVPPPAPPTDVRPAATAEGVRLTWHGAGDFVVLRRGPDETGFTQVAEVQQPEWLDRGAEFGKPYTYLVQHIVKLSDDRTAQSELSEPASITPKDTFPPAAPAGLHAVAAPGSLELTWDRNTEPDLAGYRVYRTAPGGALQKIADLQLPAYSDHAVETGKTYRYEISAVDQAGNESPHSAAAEATAQ